MAMNTRQAQYAIRDGGTAQRRGARADPNAKLGETRAGVRIHREIGDLSKDLLGGQKWLTYQRYIVQLDGERLRREIGLDLEDVDAANLRAMDDAANVAMLARVGSVVVTRQVTPDHFAGVFHPVPTA
jgi:hypothetical protein